MRENRTYGLMRGRAYPARDAPPYSTSRDDGDAAERRSSFALRASTFAEATVDKPEDRYDRGDQAT